MILEQGVAAVVTGGASGLGAATVRGLAAKGVKVAIFDFNVESGNAVATNGEDVRQDGTIRMAPR